MAKRKSTKLKFPLKAVVRDRQTSGRVPALINPMDDSHRFQWVAWRYGQNDLDQTWEWDQFLEQSQRMESGLECYALEAREELHGLMCLDLTGHETPDGTALVVDYVATSPANRPPHAELRDIGSILLALAVHRSRELGFEGRLWLESLPDSEIFYERCGFARLPGVSAEGNAMFSLSKASADHHWQMVCDAKQLSFVKRDVDI